MISFIRGKIHSKKPPNIVVDINGIGYECLTSMATFYQLPDIDQEVFLWTHFVVREDAQLLYAFYQEQERYLFRSLIKVNNVGPKLALAILSGIDHHHLVQSIRQQNVAALTPIPGVGKKTAERLMIELRDRIKDWEEVPKDIETLPPKEREDCMIKDAISALIALGFKPAEASRLIAQVGDNFQSAEELIRVALQHTLKGG